MSLLANFTLSMSNPSTRSGEQLAFPDSKFSASSSRSNHEASKARLNGFGAWTPSTNNNPSDYLQVDLQYEIFICAVATQGNPNADEWTLKYKLLFSLNNTDWVTYQENNADKVCFIKHKNCNKKCSYQLGLFKN